MQPKNRANKKKVRPPSVVITVQSIVKFIALRTFEHLAHNKIDFMTFCSQNFLCLQDKSSTPSVVITVNSIAKCISLGKTQTVIIVEFQSPMYCSFFCHLSYFRATLKTVLTRIPGKIQHMSTPTKLVILKTLCILVGYYPPTTAHMVWGSVHPPMRGYRVIIP